MTEIYDLIKIINGKGWLVSSLFQDGKQWNASLRPKNDFSFAHGRGHTIEEALKNAKRRMKDYKTEKDWAEIKRQKLGAFKPKKRVKLK